MSRMQSCKTEERRDRSHWLAVTSFPTADKLRNVSSVRQKIPDWCSYGRVYPCSQTRIWQRPVLAKRQCSHRPTCLLTLCSGEKDATKCAPRPKDHAISERNFIYTQLKKRIICCVSQIEADRRCRSICIYVTSTNVLWVPRNSWQLFVHTTLSKIRKSVGWQW